MASTIDQLKSLFQKAKKKTLDATTIDERLGQGLRSVARSAPVQSFVRSTASMASPIATPMIDANSYLKYRTSPTVVAQANQNKVQFQKQADYGKQNGYAPAFTPIIQQLSAKFPQIPNAVERTARYVPDKLGSIVGLKPQDNLVSNLMGGFARGTIEQMPETITGNKKLQDAQMGRSFVPLTPQEKKSVANENTGFMAGLLAGPTAKGYKPGMTGQFSNLMDKKPRFEIDDSGAMLKTTDKWLDALNGKPVDLGSLLEHKKLFQQYPDLADNTIVKFADTNSRGSIKTEGGVNFLTLDKKLFNKGFDKETKSTLLHEIQHAIQQKEGFARGGNLSTAQKLGNITEEEYSGAMANIDKAFQKRIDDLGARQQFKSFFESPTDEGVRKYNDFVKNDPILSQLEKDSIEWRNLKRLSDEPYKAYQSLAGEIESRAVQRRMDMPQSQRLTTDPYQAEMTATGLKSPQDAIVRFDETLSELSTKGKMKFKPKAALTQEEINIVDQIIYNFNKTKDLSAPDAAFIDRVLTGKAGANIAQIDALSPSQRLNEVAKFSNISERANGVSMSIDPSAKVGGEAPKYKSVSDFAKNYDQTDVKKIYEATGIKILRDNDGYFLVGDSFPGKSMSYKKVFDLYNQATTPKGVGATIQVLDQNTAKQGTPQLLQEQPISKMQKTSPQGGVKSSSSRIPIKNPVDTQSLDQGRVVPLQDQGSIPIKKAEVVTQPVQPTNTQSIPVRTSVPRASSKRSIAGNPIKDDITGVNPSGIVTKLRESVQDNWIRVKNLQRQKGVKLDEASNPYLAEELYHGRVGTRIEEVKSQIVEYDKDLLATSKKINLPDTQLKADVNKYLQAKHAPERNKLHGDGAAGMTNAEARAYLKELGASPASAEVKRLSAKVKQMNDETLDVLLESQVIDKTLYDTLRTTYKNHVPLNRIMDDSNLDEVLTGKGFNVKSSGVKKAKGSSREVADILGNVVANLESAIVRAEKNRVNLATLRFARNNKQLGIFSEIKPKAIGQTFDGKFITQEVKDPLVLTVRENGKPVYLRIADEQLAPVFQGIGNEKLPSAFKFIQKFTQFYSGLHTRFNPEFAASNVIRDTQEMAVFMASQKDVGFKGAGRTITRIPEAQRAVIDGIRGLDSEGARLYRQMKLDGGTTGGMALSTRKSVDVDLKQIEQLNRSKPRQAVQKVLESFDNWNTIFEDATRLSVYKQALENGMSRQQAASLAKNSTVNFNKKGTATPIINSLYMFSNASVQGSVKMLRAMKNPKVAAAVVTTVGSSVFAANSWNDTVDPDWRDKVTEWDRNSNLVVMLPSTDGGAKYITVPVSWGIKPIKVASDVAYDLSVGKADNIGDAAIKIASSAFDAYNPVGGEDMTSALTPSILDTPFDIARNRSWSGATIKPDWLKGLPASEQMFANTGNTTTGKIAIKTTQALAGGGIQVSPNDLLYAYNSYIGGVGKFASRVTDTVSAIATSESLVAKEIPFANRFFKTRSEEQVQMSGIFKGQDNFMKSLQKYETGSAEQATAIKNYLRGLGSDKERQSMLFKLRDQGIPTKGISYSGKKLGATNVPLKSEKVSFQQTTDQPQNILDKVALAAQGLTKDPENTIKAIFTQEELRKIEGNAVILKRQEFLNKENDPNLQRDHIIPLALGGDNSEENLKYIPKEYHAEKTKNDNRLIRELQSGKITREEAQAQVSAWIEANPHETYVMEEQPKQDDSFINQDFAIEYTKSDGTTDVKVVRVEVPEYPTLTGQAELDKKLKSAYYSKLTTAKNNTLKLYEAGKITAEEAEEILDSLDTKQKKASGRKGKKAKKIKIGSTPTLKRVSIKAPQVSQMAKIDFKIPTSQRVPIRNASTSKPRIKLKDASKRLLSVVR